MYVRTNLIIINIINYNEWYVKGVNRYFIISPESDTIFDFESFLKKNEFKYFMNIFWSKVPLNWNNFLKTITPHIFLYNTQ